MTLDQTVCDAEFPDCSQLLQCNGLDCLDQVTDMKGTVHFYGAPCLPHPPPPPPNCSQLLQYSGLDCLDQVTDMKGAVLFCGAPHPLPSPLLSPLYPPSSTPPPPPLPSSPPTVLSCCIATWVKVRPYLYGDL